MTGTWINVAGIIVGGIAGLTIARKLTPATQYRLRTILALLVVYIGFKTTWEAINGPFLQVLKQLGISLLAISLGSFTGHLIGLQRGVNRLGKLASARFKQAVDTPSCSAADGFVTATLVYCVGPMAILGSLADGLRGDWKTLALKGLLDGLGTLGFVATFGWPVMLSAIPVLAYQGTITLAARELSPWLQDQAMLDAFSATGGLMLTTIALIILDIRKVPLANYLPALVYAPLLTAWWG
ncbi:MAG: DUF554 domain-containing protein [Pedosphaera sp.]|nr:DUF554 domain-containing protein [Pedosphaera sp.]